MPGRLRSWDKRAICGQRRISEPGPAGPIIRPTPDPAPWLGTAVPPSELPPPSALRVILLGLAALLVLLGAQLEPALPSLPGGGLQPLPTPTATAVPIGPDNPLGQYVKRHRLRAFVLVVAGGAALALTLSLLARRAAGQG